jgi:dolichyl-phosphate-mannose-protein mannosyltransferase
VTEKRTNRRWTVFGLLLVVGLSAYLRLYGITWASDAGYGHYLNYQPDEFISIRGMLPINLLAGQLRAPDAYFEGTFNYYLWALPRTLRALCGGSPGSVEENVPGNQVKFILLSGRLMSVAFDLVTLVLLFAVINEITGQALAALIGALFYGVFPMQVIYSHFMRTHLLSNLLCVLVIWLSMKALKHRRSWLFVITGAVAGLATATRYPACVVLSVPCFFILFQGSSDHGSWRRRFKESIAYLLSGPVWLLASGFVIGLFIGWPMLFLDFRSVVREISFAMSYYGKFAPSGAQDLFNLGPIWKYLSVLIPYATYPVLWLPIYLSTLYVISRRPLWPVVVPLCLFAALYTYPMAKGYLIYIARQVMLLLPVFCVFVGLAFAEMFPKLIKRPLLFSLVLVLTVLFIVPSVLFDWAYGRSMSRPDVRDLLRKDLAELINKRSSPITIDVMDHGPYFYTVMPAVFPLKSEHAAVRLERSLNTSADFFVVGRPTPLAENWHELVTRRVEGGGALALVEFYNQAPTVFGKTFNLSNFPPDMTYPFPRLLLFRKVTKPEG